MTKKDLQHRANVIACNCYSEDLGDALHEVIDVLFSAYPISAEQMEKITRAMMFTLPTEMLEEILAHIRKCRKEPPR